MSSKSWSWEAALQEEAVDLVLSHMDFDEMWADYITDNTCPWCAEKRFMAYENGSWECSACGMEGANPVEFYREYSNVSFADALKHLYDSHVEPLAPPDAIQLRHDALMNDENALLWLKRHGMDIGFTKRFQMGWMDNNRFVVPIYNRFGYATSTGSFKPRGDNPQELENLYPLPILRQSDHVVLVQSLKECLVCLAHNMAVVTTGHHKWMIKEGDLRFLKGKNVTIAYYGEATKSAEEQADRLCGHVRSVRILTFPLKTTAWKVSSLTQFLTKTKCANPVGELGLVIKDAPLYRSANPNIFPPASSLLPSPSSIGVTASQGDLQSSFLFGKHFCTRAVVIYSNPTPLSVPIKMAVSCHGPKWPCADNGCPFSGGPTVTHTVDVDVNDHEQFPRLLGAVGNGEIVSAVCDHLDIKPDCRLRVKALATCAVWPIQLENQLEALYVGDRPPLGTTLNLYGYQTSSEYQGQILVFTGHESAKSAIESYEVSKVSQEILAPFAQISKPSRGEGSFLDDLLDFYRHVSESITGIADRALTHAAIDLPFFSPPTFSFRSHAVDRGSLDIMVLSEPGCGERLIAERLSKYYRFGEIVPKGPKGAIHLLGRATEGKVSWGRIPLNDLGVVVLDKATEITFSAVRLLGPLRRTGVASLFMRGQRYDHPARCALVWLCDLRDANYRKMRLISSAVQKAGKMEEGDNLDYTHVMSARDNSPVVTRLVPHYYGHGQYLRLIRWVKSRTREQVVFTDEAEKLIKGHKTAKVAAAVAGKVYSTDKTGENLIVDGRCAATAVLLMQAFKDDAERVFKGAKA